MAGGALRPGAPAPAAASQLTLLVMRPCGGPDEAAADGVLRQAPAPAPGGGAAAGQTLGYLCEVAGDGEEEAGEDEADLLDTSDPPGGGESTASLEDLEDEETPSGGEGGSGAARRRGSGGGGVSKTCTYEGCHETTSQVAKQRKPWMCKKHRNKMYKDKYKKKKSDQALNCGGAAPAGSVGSVKLEVSDPGWGRGEWGVEEETPLSCRPHLQRLPPPARRVRLPWPDLRPRVSECLPYKVYTDVRCILVIDEYISMKMMGHVRRAVISEIWDVDWKGG